MDKLQFASETIQSVLQAQKEVIVLLNHEDTKDAMKSMFAFLNDILREAHAGLDKVAILNAGTTRIEHANGGTSTAAVNTELKAGVQQEIPFRDKASENKSDGKENINTTLAAKSEKKDETAAGDNKAELLDESKVDQEKVDQEAVELAKAEAAGEVADTEEEKTNQLPAENEETDDKQEENAETVVSENRMNEADAREYLKGLIQEANKAGKRDNDSKLREELHAAIIDTFPADSEYVKTNKEGKTARNRIIGGTWNEVMTEARKALTEKVKAKEEEKTEKVVAGAQNKVDEILEDLKKDNVSVLDTKSAATAAAPVTKVLADVPEKTKIVSMEEVAAAKAADVDLVNCKTPDFIAAMKKDVVETASSMEDLEPGSALFTKWRESFIARPETQKNANHFGTMDVKDKITGQTVKKDKSDMFLKGVMGMIRKDVERKLNAEQKKSA